VDASSFILNHLEHFVVVMFWGELINKIISSLKFEVKESAANKDNKEFNPPCHFTANSYMTILHWVYYFRFKQDRFKKSYYVNDFFPREK
jgi:hypothetical protein